MRCFTSTAREVEIEVQGSTTQTGGLPWAAVRGLCPGSKVRPFFVILQDNILCEAVSENIRSEHDIDKTTELTVRPANALRHNDGSLFIGDIAPLFVLCVEPLFHLTGDVERVESD